MINTIRIKQSTKLYLQLYPKGVYIYMLTTHFIIKDGNALTCVSCICSLYVYTT